MNIYIASDHAGFKLKQYIYDTLNTPNKTNEKQYTPNDIGCYTEESCDYPDFAHLLAKQMGSNSGIGILICGSGQGMAMTANKHSYIRACVAWEPEIAKLSREHNDANVLCLPARFMTNETAMLCVNTFLDTKCSQQSRHCRRIEKIKKVE